MENNENESNEKIDNIYQERENIPNQENKANINNDTLNSDYTTNSNGFKSNFTTVSNNETYSNYSNNKKGSIKGSIKEKNKNKEKNNIFVPFLSGVLGGALVIGACVYSPSLQSALFDISDNSSTSTDIEFSSTSESNGYIEQVSLTNYSDTSIYAANTILPSIVGIEVDYTISNNSAMFGSSSRFFFYCNCNRFWYNN